MIRIRRTNRAPGKLKRDGQGENLKNIRLFATGASHLEFDKAIYGSKVVREVLRLSQHDKCCYCEKDTSDWPGDVEHFRPKTAVKIAGVSKMRKPAYFWLAYDWDNLLWACNTCNRSYKKNHFPLASEAVRASPVGKSVGSETPLLLNPLVDDPTKHIGFRNEYPYHIDDSIKGAKTIKIVGLAREKLNEKRRSHIDIIGALATIVVKMGGTPDADRARSLLKKFASDKGQFSLCTRHFLLNVYGVENPDAL